MEIKKKKTVEKEENITWKKSDRGYCMALSNLSEISESQ